MKNVWKSGIIFSIPQLPRSIDYPPTISESGENIFQQRRKNKPGFLPVIASAALHKSSNPNVTEKMQL